MRSGASENDEMSKSKAHTSGEKVKCVSAVGRIKISCRVAGVILLWRRRSEVIGEVPGAVAASAVVGEALRAP